MGRVKTVQASTGTSAGTVTGIDGTATAKSANYTVTDTDRIRTILMTTGSTSFTFVDGDVNTGTDAITEASHGYSDGQALYLTTTGVVPAGLRAYVPYFMVSTAASAFDLAATVGGASVDITAAAGGGTHTVNIGKTVTLPTAADNINRIITVKKVDSGTGWCFIDAEGSETIDGVTFKYIAAQYDYITVQSDGSNWHMIDWQVTDKVTISNTSANSLVNNTAENLLTYPLILTPGTWLVTGSCIFDGAGATTYTVWRFSLNTTSATDATTIGIPASDGTQRITFQQASATAGQRVMQLIPATVTVAANQDYYLVGNVDFAVSTAECSRAAVTALRLRP